jgi:hypothetical protein
MYACICICIYMYVCICICIYMYTCIYTQLTHTQLTHTTTVQYLWSGEKGRCGAMRCKTIPSSRKCTPLIPKLKPHDVGPGLPHTTRPLAGYNTYSLPPPTMEDDSKQQKMLCCAERRTCVLLLLNHIDTNTNAHIHTH